MGSCLSISSPESHKIQHGSENVVYIQGNQCADEVHEVGSIFSYQGSKGHNQDAAILYQGYVTENGAFCGVFDGHGHNGHVISKLVRNKLPLYLLNQINASKKISSTQISNEKAGGEFLGKENFSEWKDAFLNAFKVMDKDIKLLKNVDSSCSGTTAVVVVKQGEYLMIANLGDSRAILGTKTEVGIIDVPLTIDLKPGLPAEAERIRKCRGRVVALKEEPHVKRVWLPHNDSPGLAMSRAFGDFLLKNHGIISIPHVSYHHLSPNDQFIVLATDGVWDVLSNNQVISIVSAAATEAAAARAVVEASIVGWRKRFPNSRRDDSTVICLFLRNKG